MTDTIELSKAYEPTEVENRWSQFWLERRYFHAESTSDRPPFCIVLPPPNVTGSLHLGHALTATIEDILIRWKRMSGYNALWMPGTDHAGIATQMVVEKELKKTEQKSRHDLGREEFLRRVWQWKEQYGKRIGEQHQFLGASLDWERERFTMDEKSSAAVREVFVRLHEEGLIYRAHKLINWCPSCHTALSDLEVEHEEKKGSLWHIRYPVKDSDRTLTVATTRPETMLGDTAVAIHPEDPRYQGLAGGTVLLPLVDREIPIVADAELVNMEFGTGVVKVTPAHDFNDYQTGLRHHLPMISIFDDSARTTKEAGAFSGLNRQEARMRVLEELTLLGLLEKEEPHTLSVGHCQRCGTVVEPRLSPQWFVKTVPLAKPVIEAVEQGRTKIVPESWTSTFYQWMHNIHDWCVSRQLWWGHQIPAYYCTSCSPRVGDDTDQPLDAPTVRVGGIDFARAEPIVARQQPPACPRCGGSTFTQDPDVLDTWFSSALWPFSTLGWPEQTPELKTFYPTSVLETGHDIIFFWVARMMMMGVHFMGDVPFRTVYLHAMVRDEKGEKMSKTKGNVIDPLEMILGAPADKLTPTLRNKFPQGMPAFGADALRFTLASLTQQGRDIKLSMERVAGYKAFGNKLWNASRFVLMNLGEFRLDSRPIKERPLTLADRWILARLQRAAVDTRLALEQYAFSDAASTLYQFLWSEFCDWYIELSKGPLYGDDPAAKDTTRAVLVFCLERILRLMHPFMPFITEEIWQKLPVPRTADSIMISPYPEPDSRLADFAAETEMGPIVAAIEGLRTIRGESNLPPSARLVAYVQSPNETLRATLERWQGYLMPLAGLSEVHVEPPGRKPPQCAAFVGSELEIYVPLAGLIDVEAERERLSKEMARAEQELVGVMRKLDNPNFVAKAPPDVVEKDRARVEELKARKEKLRENLERLAPESAVAEEEEEAPPLDAEDTLTHPESSRVKVAPPSVPAEDSVDLSQELKSEMEASAEIVNPQITDALNKLREGTKEGLTAKDHHDLGVAYMSMGLVDDAMREFDKAKQEGDERPVPEQVAPKAPLEAAPTVKPPAKKAPATKKAAPKKGSAKKSGAAKKRSASKSVAVKKGPAKSAAVKKGPAKKSAAAKKGPAKKGPARKGASAKKGSASRRAAAKKRPALKSASKKPAKKKLAAKSSAIGRGAKKPAAKKAGKRTPAKARR